MLDAVEAAASCAKADAERPASAAAADPFDDFETASSSGSNSLLAAESFDRQMSDVVDRSLEESRVRYLNMAFTTIAKVGVPRVQVKRRPSATAPTQLALCLRSACYDF